MGSKTFTASSSSVLVATGHIIRLHKGRADLQLMLDGKVRDTTLTYTSSRQWEDASVFWSGVIGAGKHTAYLRGGNANIWGCQDNWGDLDITIIPTSAGGTPPPPPPSPPPPPPPPP